MLIELRIRHKDREYDRSLAKINNDNTNEDITTSRIEYVDQDLNNNSLPKWTKKLGIRRGEGWTDGGIDRFYELLDMVEIDRMTEENKIVEDQLLMFWREMHKGNKKKIRKRRVAVVVPTKKKVRRSYDSDTDDETPNTSTNVVEC